MDAIVTVPPYAPWINEIARHPAVSGLRLNTVMPIKEPHDDLLRRLRDLAGDKALYVDLKGRQLRVRQISAPPYTDIKLSHSISVNTPVTAYFHDGEEKATITAVDGDRLIMLGGPKRPVGPGESVNIPDPSLTVHGYFTRNDLAYLSAAERVGVPDIMLSFVESAAEVDQLKKLYVGARPVLKIESARGMSYVRDTWDGEARLMAARGDLYVEIQPPHTILPALEDILEKDPTAILASRIFPSLANRYHPRSEDIGDVDGLMRMGYQTYMLGDDVCQQRESVVCALNLLHRMMDQYGKRHAS